MKNYFLKVSLFLILLIPQALQASVGGSNGLGSGRTLPGIAAIAGLVGVITGVSVMRSKRTNKTGTNTAVLLGLTALIIGILHGTNAAGGFGTGNGLAGAIVAMVLGTIAVITGGIAQFRNKRDSTNK